MNPMDRIPPQVLVRTFRHKANGICTSDLEIHPAIGTRYRVRLTIDVKQRNIAVLFSEKPRPYQTDHLVCWCATIVEHLLTENQVPYDEPR